MKKTITLSLGSIIALGLMSFGILNSGGKANKTGGHGEGGCTCHSSALNTAVVLNVTASGTLLSQGYVAGTTYTINVTVSEPGQPLFGFDFQALNTAKASVGTLTAGLTGDNTLLTGGTIINVVHDGNGTFTAGSHTFSFTWQAPTPVSPTDSVIFWYSGLGADGDGANNAADHWNKGSNIILPDPSGILENSTTNINISIFPNPVSETAEIYYELEANSTVSAHLINVSGQVIADFFDAEKQTAGNHNRKLRIDPAIAKGIYFVAINVNGKNSYKKITVN